MLLHIFISPIYSKQCSPPPHFPPLLPTLPSPSPLPCCAVCVEKNRALILAKSDINSFLSSDVQQNLPLINICSVSEPQGYWLLCFHCCLFSDTLLILMHWHPPPCLRPGARARQWAGHSSLLNCIFLSPPSFWNRSLFVSLWTIKSWYCGDAKKKNQKQSMCKKQFRLSFVFSFFVDIFLHSSLARSKVSEKA